MKPQLGTSSWSLNRTLGAPNYDALLGKTEREATPHALSLLELPARLSEMGVRRLEICHFHLPSRDPEFVAQLRAALDEANVELWSLLIDGGDITHPQNGARDVEWTQGWIDIAADLGACHARVIAGKAAPTDDNLKLSRDRLKTLCAHAKTRGVRILIENWFDLLSSPREVLWLLDELNGEIGLNIDFGNWKGDDKYDKLQAIAHRAESSHTKAHFRAPRDIDLEDFTRCLDITRNAGFSGSHTLIYDGEDADEWTHLALERDIVLPYLN